MAGKVACFTRIMDSGLVLIRWLGLARDGYHAVHGMMHLMTLSEGLALAQRGSHGIYGCRTGALPPVVYGQRMSCNVMSNLDQVDQYLCWFSEL